MGMLAEGVEFMVIGMGTVFAFLTLLVFAVKAAAWVIETYFPPPPEPAPQQRAAAAVSADAEIAVVLAAAYRWRQGQGE
jgi:oxaloacetate decarboxylase gamma subunit